MTRPFVVGIGCLVLAACTGVETVGGTAALVGDKDDTKTFGVPKCPGWACPEADAQVYIGGTSSGRQTSEPTVSIPVPTSSWDGVWSPDHTQIIAAQTFDGTPVQIQVTADQLLAVEIKPPYEVLRGMQLQGATMWMALDNGMVFSLYITNVYLQNLVFWEGDAEFVPAYEILAMRVDAPDPKGPSFLCSGAGTETDPRWGGVPHAAILFHGDYFDFGHETMAQPWSPGQFNIGCPGSTMARMHLSRHTQASVHESQFVTTHDQRVAMLKMFEADYCGNGQSFTPDNYPLRWLDNTGWAQPPLDLDPQHGQITSIEAIWGPGGAVCLDTPRTYPREQIPCALPLCTNIPSWPAQGHLISANPPQ